MLTSQTQKNKRIKSEREHVLKRGKHIPDAAVLAANSSVPAGGVYTHVIKGGLPDHMVRASELSSSVSLLHHKQTPSH